MNKESSLGVYWGHGSSVGLLFEGTTVAAVNEERFTRHKNQWSCPIHSFRYCREILAAEKRPIDIVGVCNLSTEFRINFLQHSDFTIQDAIREQHEVWKPRLYENKEVDFLSIFKEKWARDQYPQSYWEKVDPYQKDNFAEDRNLIIAEALEITPDKVHSIEHHWCHAHYAYSATPFSGEKSLVLTIDGAGDGLNATIVVADEKGEMERIYKTDRCVIGHIYTYITLLLGMKRLEHEYKVMGLAPYAYPKAAEQAFQVFDELVDLEGIDFVWKNKPKDSYFHFQRKLEGIRFDAIAGGLQLWVERLLCRWVRNIVKETGIKRLIISGGVAMNVKAMGKIADLPEVEHLFVPGVGSDESTALGAAVGASKLFGNHSKNWLFSVPSLYLGPEAEEDWVDFKADDFVVSRDAGPEAVALLLQQGKVLGRCVGRMEFGQRSLGNRSILADPVDIDVVQKINSMIKQRDFWMPFAPVVLDSFAEKYLINPKGIRSPHMTITYGTTAEGWKAMRAACHAADRTVRAQILEEKANPELYQILTAFAKLTGRGALLNTSFNLHGYPIVNKVAEAFEVFTASELEGLVLAKMILLKKESKPGEY